jgi:hypothetical protein
MALRHTFLSTAPPAGLLSAAAAPTPLRVLPSTAQSLPPRRTRSHPPDFCCWFHRGHCSPGHRVRPYRRGQRRHSSGSRSCPPVVILLLHCDRCWYLLTHTENSASAWIPLYREYSRVSYLFTGKQWLKKLIIRHHVFTNLIHQLD